MSRQTFLKRLGAGLALLILLLALAFALTLPMIHRWGATDEEVASALPGDDLLPQPIVNWTNSITIDASPAEVWPWIVQMGDTRGGFYSYTFIENRVGAIFGSADYQVVYRNAGRIIPEWQNPAPGDEIIQGTLKIREAQPGQWLLADSVSADTFGWTWLWRLYPAGNGQQTRLVNRMRIQTPAELNNPVLTFVMDIGGFVMEQNMMQGIKTRAEGGREPAAIEAVEIIIWLAALLTGLVAAGFYLFQPAWQRPLVVAVASVLVLMVLTFVQPAIWLRLVLDALLWLALWWAYSPAQEETAINVAFA